MHRRTRGFGRTCAPLRCASLPVQRACFAFLRTFSSFVCPCMRACVRITVRSWYAECSMRSRSLAGRTRVVVARVAGEGRAGWLGVKPAFVLARFLSPRKRSRRRVTSSFAPRSPGILHHHHRASIALSFSIPIPLKIKLLQSKNAFT